MKKFKDGQRVRFVANISGYQYSSNRIGKEYVIRRAYYDTYPPYGDYTKMEDGDCIFHQDLELIHG